MRNCLLLDPYKPQNVQNLLKGDRKYAWNLQSTAHQAQTKGLKFYQKCFTEKCMFRMNEVINKQNVTCFGTEHPEEHDQNAMSSPGLMTLYATPKIYKRPIFFENVNATAERYMNGPASYTFPSFRHFQEDYIFQPDGPHLHYSNQLRDHLDSMRPIH